MNYVTIDFETAKYSRTHFGQRKNAHNALDDAMTCGKLLLLSAEKNGAANVARLLTITGMEMGALV
ncbi:MAG: hypothetical protein LBQ94_03535 [Treponema sp.]|jgi:DNA polymerase III epsilon subunit-like protein|nr:hypothetical protein [Treponema sp.]